MATRPAKRQRRSTLILSDSDEENEGLTRPPPRASARHGSDSRADTRTDSKPGTPRKRSTRSKSVRASPNKAYEKPRNANQKSELANRSLHNFFIKATEEQRWNRKSATPEVDTKDGTFDDDIVDDDSIDEAMSFLAGQADTQASADTAHDNSVPPHKQHTLSSSQRRFAKPSIPKKNVDTRSPGTVNNTIEHKPWADRYGPDNLDELGVHKKKVGDVQRWLDNAFNVRGRQRLLVLKGPAGSGKTSTVSLIGKASGIQIIQWQNPTVSETGIASAIQQFSDFLERGGDYQPLEMQAGNSVHGRDPVLCRRLLLVEELPVVMTRFSNALDSFRFIIRQYLTSVDQMNKHQAGIQSLDTHPPVIMIISETLLSSSTALTDSFTAHRVLGPELSNHPLVTIIEFNPVAPTFVRKVLDTVIKKESQDSNRKTLPRTAVISKLAEISDVRSAINSLEFFCARLDDQTDSSSASTAHTKKRSAGSLTEPESKTLQMISQRESTLDMFHAAGKIVYNKREDPRVLDTRAEPPPKPPDHLMHLYSPKASQVDIDVLFNETGTDIQTFISTLHENYIPSCGGDSFVDSLEACADFFSISDILSPSSRASIGAKRTPQQSSSNSQGGNFDMLRQDEISFQTATRGLLFSLPFPVRRAALPGARKQDAFKMFYPSSLRLWKPMEEVHDLLLMYMNRRLLGMSCENVQDTPAEGVATWRSRTLGFAGGTIQNAIQERRDETTTLKVVTSEDVHILEILPYMAKIYTAKDEDAEIPNRITQHRGWRLVSGETSDEESDVIPLSLRPAMSRGSNLSRKIEATHSSLKSQKVKTGRLGLDTSSASIETSNIDDSQTDAMGKLYISDDDIEDD